VTITITDLVSVLTLLLVINLLVLLWQLVSRRHSSQENKHYRSGSPPALPFLRKVPTPPPDESPPRRIKSNKERWNALTIHQRKIATLAAQGQQNGEIAQALQIRSSTVSTHLKTIYKTLGIHSRRELANFFQDLEV
jgi:DNA-binding NarL/FixJ family response regulator